MSLTKDILKHSGGGSVLLKKERSYSEVYNDLDFEIVNLFQQYRDSGDDLKRALSLTPFSREEFKLSYQTTDDLFERARRTVIRSFMGFGSAAVTKQKTGFRANSNRSGTTPAHDWKNYPRAMDAIIDRLQGVVIENKDATYILNKHDSESTLHFQDPPDVLDTRYNGQKTKCYSFEMSNQDHVNLCKTNQNLQGYICLCGYENEIYNDLLPDWSKHYKKTYADSAKERTEVLYINPKLTQALSRTRQAEKLVLF